MLKEEGMVNFKKADCFEIWRNPLGDRVSFILWDSTDKSNRMEYEMSGAELRKLMEENF